MFYCGFRNLLVGVNEEYMKGVVYGGFYVIGEFEVIEVGDEREVVV